MIKCPKCGFTQPPDQFCASCGVDVNAFQPEKPPVTERVIKNSYSRFIIIFIFVIFAIVIMKDNLPQSMQFGESSTEESEVSDYEYGSYEAEQARREQIEAALGDEDDSEDEDEEFNDESNPQEEFVADQKVREEKKSVKPPKLNIHYLEVDRGLLENWIRSAKNVGGGGDQQFGVLANFSKLLGETSRDLYQSLDIVRNEELGPGVDVRSFNGFSTDLESTLGLDIEVIALPSTGDSYNFEARISYQLIDPTDPERLIGWNSTERFSVPAGGSSFISGILPRLEFPEPIVEEEIPEGEEELAPIPPPAYGSSQVLRVLESRDFRELDTEFVIVFELASSN